MRSNCVALVATISLRDDGRRDSVDYSRVEDAEVLDVPVSTTVLVADVAPSPWQPRSCVNEDEAFIALCESIRELGIIQPVAVRVLADGTLELIAGQRRLRACQALGKSCIVAHLHRDLTDAGAQAMTIAENLARLDLYPLEEARAVAALRNAREADNLPANVRVLGMLVGRSKSLIAELLHVDQAVPDAVITMVREVHGDDAARCAMRSPKVTLLRAAKEDTIEDAARILAGSYASHAEFSAPPDGTDAAFVHAVDKNLHDSPKEAFKLNWGPTKRLHLSTTAPVSCLAPHDAQQLLVALQPVLAALHQRAKTDD